jgi:transcriptional regulator NrdR family protein
LTKTFNYQTELKKLARKIDKDVKTIAKRLKEYHEWDVSSKEVADTVYSDLVEELMNSR